MSDFKRWTTTSKCSRHQSPELSKQETVVSDERRSLPVPGFLLRGDRHALSSNFDELHDVIGM